MTAFLIEIAGLFAFAIHTRLAWFRRAAWNLPSAYADWRNWADFGGVLGGLGLALYAKFVMPIWAALLMEGFFLGAVWFGLSGRGRESFQPAALFFALMPLGCALLLWFG
ncbi:MAG: hypothetical protein AAF676_04810 [Pseudomonadota bacterium]